MNATQRVVLWSALAVAIVSALFPPWVYIRYGGAFAGYAFLFTPPSGASLAAAHLLVQTALLAIILALAYIIAGISPISQQGARRTIVIFSRVAMSLVVLAIAALFSRLNHAFNGGPFIDLLVPAALIWALYKVWAKKKARSPRREPPPDRYAKERQAATPIKTPDSSWLGNALFLIAGIGLLTLLLWVASGGVQRFVETRNYQASTPSEPRPLDARDK